MKVTRPSGSEAAALLLLLASSSPAAAMMLDCKNLVVDKHKFDLGALAGPHSVVTSEHHPPTYTNTTYTLDICAYLKRSDDVPKDQQCKNGARVCGIKRLLNPDKKIDEVESVIHIAGQLLDKGGKEFSWEGKRLKTSDSADDADKEGVRVTLKGGINEGRTQRAVVEFRCNRTMEGTENEWDSEDKYVPGSPDNDAAKLLRRIDEVTPREDEKDGKDGKDKDPQGFPETQLKKEGAALIWESRKSVDDTDTLYLTWYTKHACEKREDDGADEPPPAKSHWGFFTWLVILVFLGTATYLIFGSWLNYNRYGARGWDLLPHGDTIRDVPYLLKDWTRRVLNTVQGSGSRGGYSAV